MTRLINIPAEDLRDRDWTAEETGAVAAVLGAYRALVDGPEPADIAHFYSPAYVDHASTVGAGDLEALRAFVSTFQDSYPGATIVIEQVLADRDHVFVRTRARRAPEDHWDAVMEAFRVEHGQVAEHWEVIERAETSDTDTDIDTDTGTGADTGWTALEAAAYDGTRIAVRARGPRDGEPVLFLHGVSSSSRTYDWLPAELTEGRRIVTADFRGHGASGWRAGTYTLPNYTEDAIAVLEQIIGRPAVVVGFSLGATVAWTLAQVRPELVSAVFLEEPIIFPEDVYESGAIPETLRKTIEQEKEWTALGLDADQAAVQLGASAAGPKVTMADLLIPAELRTLAGSMLVRDRGVVEAAIDATMTVDVDRDAPVKVPAEVVAGGDQLGSVFGTAHAARLSRTHPEVVVHRVEESGHLIHNSVAGRPPYTRALKAFLDEHAGA